MGGGGGARIEELVNRDKADRGYQSYRPEVVNQNIEHTQKNNKNNSTPLGLETDNDHDARDQTEQANQDAPEAPLTRENEADEQEDKQHTTSKLHVHLAVLLIELGQTGRDELLADPRVGQHHEQTTDNTQITQEKVEIEDKTIAQTLCDNNSEQSRDGVLGLLACDDQSGTDGHCDDVDDQEEVCDSPWNYIQRKRTKKNRVRDIFTKKDITRGCVVSLFVRRLHEAPMRARDCDVSGHLTVSEIVEVDQLVTPLCEDAQ